MTAPAVLYRFRRLPSPYRYFPRAVFGRRAALVAEGGCVPRLEGSVESVRAARMRLARYRRVCGFDVGRSMPITFPHVLAMPLHVALLTHPRFPVRLMGLIHVANDIRQERPLPADGGFRLASWIEGYREADRGQEFELHTTLADSEGIAWREKSTLLARRAPSGSTAARSARRALRHDRPREGQAVTSTTLHVPRSVGRRYGWLSGDLNPIHLADRGARLFGFDRAVAHGMWSMARVLAELGAGLPGPPVHVHVEFKFPLFMPSRALLEHWADGARRVFVLKDAATGRPHLAGDARAG